MYRLRVIPLFLPSLRQRPADVMPLVERFLFLHNQAGRTRRVERVSPGARRTLLKHDWPGNVRELQNVVEYAFLFGDGPVLHESDLPDDVRDHEPSDSQYESQTLAPDLSSDARRIVRALERAAGNRNRAAASLGMSRSTLWRKMKEYGLGRSDYQGKT